MAKKKKTKKEEPFTPHDLAAMSAETRRALGGRAMANDAEKTSKDSQAIKKVIITILTILLALLILWLISLFVTQYGDLVINTDRGLRDRGIVLSETSDFKNSRIELSAPQAEDVTNITYKWLPEGLDKKDGPHNGKNYLAYTFYLKNGGKQKVNYRGTMKITGVANGMDEAIRVMIYKNGESLIYAKAQKKDRKKAEKDTIAFINNDTVMQTQSKDFTPGSVDKYTVVIWVEGNDSECVNDILGGYVRSEILFEVADKNTSSGTDSIV